MHPDPAENPSTPPAGDARKRPGCLVAYVVVYLLLLTAALFVAMTYIIVALTGENGLRPDAVPSIAIILVMSAPFFAVALGLWRVRNWARIVVMLLMGGALLWSLAMLMMSLLSPQFSTDRKLVFLVVQAPALLLESWAIYWFAINRRVFR